MPNPKFFFKLIFSISEQGCLDSVYIMLFRCEFLRNVYGNPANVRDFHSVKLVHGHCEASFQADHQLSSFQLDHQLSSFQLDHQLSSFQSDHQLSQHTVN